MIAFAFRDPSSLSLLRMTREGLLRSSFFVLADFTNILHLSADHTRFVHAYDARITHLRVIIFVSFSGVLQQNALSNRLMNRTPNRIGELL